MIKLIYLHPFTLIYTVFFPALAPPCPPSGSSSSFVFLFIDLPTEDIDDDVS